MRKLLAIFFALILAPQAFSLGNMPQPKTNPPKAETLMIENFEDGDYIKNPEWWTFGSAQFSITRKALSIKGTARDWYVGGLGAYIGDPGRDYSNYQNIAMDVFGHGPKSGILKIELYDDDNRNKHIEQDQNAKPLFDDCYVYELKVDWQGFKHISIPFSDFKDVNPGVGDNIWNPNVSGGSYGLIQMQFIAVAGSKTGTVDLAIDNIEFTRALR